MEVTHFSRYIEHITRGDVRDCIDGTCDCDDTIEDGFGSEWSA
jgi:hypothetical protein